MPVLVYNVAHRTGRPLTATTLRRLAQIPNITGFKHSVGGIDDDTISFMSDTSVLAGDDFQAAPLLALRASGAILASANVATRAYADMVTAWLDGPTDRARSLHNRLTRALFAEPNPVVIKAVLAARGQIPSPCVRLPLLASSAAATTAALACRQSQRTARLGQSSTTEASMMARTVRRHRPQSAPAPHASAICFEVDAPAATRSDTT